MKALRHSPTFAFVLCMVTLFVAHTFGNGAIYICLCAGQPMATQTSHCHGPHGADCHSEESDSGRATHGEKHGEREDHHAVPHDPSARLSATDAPLAAPPAVAAMLPFFESLLAPRASKISARTQAVEESPPRAVAVARTVILRI